MQLVAVVCLCCVVLLACLHSGWLIVLFSFALMWLVGYNLCCLVFALGFVFTFGVLF